MTGVMTVAKNIRRWWSQVTWEEKAMDLVLQLDESRCLVRDLEKTINMWQESSVEDDRARDKLQKQMDEVLEETEVERQKMQKQSDELLDENIHLSARCESLKAEYSRIGNQLDIVYDDLQRTAQELTHYKMNNLQRAQEVLRAQTIRVTRHGVNWRCAHSVHQISVRDTV